MRSTLFTVASATALVSMSFPSYVAINVPEPPSVYFASTRERPATVSVRSSEKVFVIARPTPSEIVVTAYSP